MRATSNVVTLVCTGCRRPYLTPALPPEFAALFELPEAKARGLKPKQLCYNCDRALPPEDDRDDLRIRGGR